MKRVLFPLIVVVAAVALLSGVVTKAEVRENHECTLASLHGSYGFTSTGNLIDVGPVANVGTFTFDGEGNLSQHLTNSRNGVITRGGGGTGTYTVNSDCRGSWAISTGTTADFAIMAGGDEVMFIRTNEGATITGILKKQSSPHQGN